jgi:NADH:ubiquinone oxidoreductase subunit K
MFIFISEIFGHARGQGYALILLAAAAAESAVGLALVVYRFHVTTSIYLDDLNMLKG